MMLKSHFCCVWGLILAHIACTDTKKSDKFIKISLKGIGGKRMI